VWIVRFFVRNVFLTVLMHDGSKMENSYKFGEIAGIYALAITRMPILGLKA
jgi:hypothetical protein